MILPVRVKTHPPGARWQSPPVGSRNNVMRMLIMITRALREVHRNQTPLFIFRSFSFPILFNNLLQPLSSSSSAGVNKSDLSTAYNTVGKYQPELVKNKLSWECHTRGYKLK